MSDEARKTGGEGRKAGGSVTLREVAATLGLSPATVSVVLNRSPVADSIPQDTQDRVFEAARRLKYRPNQLARSLRSRQSRTVGVLVPETLEPYAAGVMSGIERHLISEGYFYLVASHQSREDLTEEYLALLEGRQVDGLILVATHLTSPPGVPTVAVAGHQDLEGVTNLCLDHDHAAELALSHLKELGHERIVLVKGQPHNADTEPRWTAILSAADRLGIEIRDELVFELSDHGVEGPARTEFAYQQGYDLGRMLVEGEHQFTAIFTFNDVSAIGSMRAFVESGLRVPEDVSVIGFDDIISAAFHNPGLTTIRQPLSEMGRIAARRLLDRLAAPESEPSSETITVNVELVVRESTGPARGSSQSLRSTG